jgi:hypothetical protein
VDNPRIGGSEVSDRRSGAGSRRRFQGSRLWITPKTREDPGVSGIALARSESGDSRLPETRIARMGGQSPHSGDAWGIGPHVWEAPPHTCVRRSRYIEWTHQTCRTGSGPGFAMQSGSDPDLCVLTVRRPTRSPRNATGPSSSTGCSTRLAISAVKERAFREQASKTHTHPAIRVCDPGDLPGPDGDQQKERAAHSEHRCLPVLPSRYTPLLDTSPAPSLSPVRESDSVRLGPGN